MEPMTLYVYQWETRPVFLRLGPVGGERPGCPYLYDEVIEIPVVDGDDPPPSQHTRTVPLVADWLADILEEDDAQLGSGAAGRRSRPEAGRQGAGAEAGRGTG